jgi:hypothetical protein
MFKSTTKNAREESVNDKSDRAAKAAKAATRQLSIYSSRSDHMPVELECILEFGGKENKVKIFGYNISYASDLALWKPFGSESYFLSRLRDDQQRNHYMIKAIELIKEHFEKYSAILIQEVNDADEVTYVEGVHDDRAFEFYDDGTSKFLGGFQGILRKLANDENLIIPEKQDVGDGSYYTTGTFGNHCYLAYSVEKIVNGKKLYPTVLTIWKKDTLGEFKAFYGKDLGINSLYDYENSQYRDFHHGRPFSCVRTTKGVTIINMHGPNSYNGHPDIIGKLKPTILTYMKEADDMFLKMKGKEAEESGAADVWDWNMSLTILGGDLNDTMNELKNIDFKDKTLKLIEGEDPDKTCCVEFEGEIQGNYNKFGDLLLAENPISKVTIVHAISSQRGKSDVGSSQEASQDLYPVSSQDSRQDSRQDLSQDLMNGGSTSYHTLKKKKSKSIKKARTIRYKTNKKNKTNNSRKHNKRNKSRKHNKRNKRNKSRKHN